MNENWIHTGYHVTELYDSNPTLFVHALVHYVELFPLRISFVIQIIRIAGNVSTPILSCTESSHDHLHVHQMRSCLRKGSNGTSALETRYSLELLRPQRVYVEVHAGIHACVPVYSAVRVCVCMRGLSPRLWHMGGRENRADIPVPYGSVQRACFEPNVGDFSRIWTVTHVTDCDQNLTGAGVPNRLKVNLGAHRAQCDGRESLYFCPIGEQEYDEFWNRFNNVRKRCVLDVRGSLKFVPQFNGHSAIKQQNIPFTLNLLSQGAVE